MSLTTADNIRVSIDLGNYTVQGVLIGLTLLAYVVSDDYTGLREVCWKTEVKHIEIL